MPRTLSDEDCDAIVQKLFERLARCLVSDSRKAPDADRDSIPSHQAVAITSNSTDAKLAYTRKELSALLGISSVTLWRLQARGLIQPVPGIRRKIFARQEVERFLNTSSKGKAFTKLRPTPAAKTNCD